MNRIAQRQTFFILCFSGCMKKPTVTRVGRGFWGPEGKEKAMGKAKALAEGNPANRYYVCETLCGFRAPPKSVQSVCFGD